jgi:hypothetical protein
MPKIIKIKESDIRKIARNIIKEQFGDFDTQVQPEELPNDPEIELTLARDKNGVFYVLKNAQNGTPEVVAKAR